MTRRQVAALHKLREEEMEDGEIRELKRAIQELGGRGRKRRPSNRSNSTKVPEYGGDITSDNAERQPEQEQGDTSDVRTSVRQGPIFDQFIFPIREENQLGRQILNEHHIWT